MKMYYCTVRIKDQLAEAMLCVALAARAKGSDGAMGNHVPA